MDRSQIFELPGLPPAAPSYPSGPFRFINREYLIVTYLSDPEAIREALPEPLEPDGSHLAHYEFIRMPDSSGFGDYTESGIVIPAIFDGRPVNYTAQMYLDCEPPITGGREIWGFPKKLASPKLCVKNDTLVGTLDYSGERVAMATMAYKHTDLIYDLNSQQKLDQSPILEKLHKPICNLKLIPDVDGRLRIAQLVEITLADITLKGAWSGPARLHLIPHVNAPVADLPVRKVVGGLHILADLTLPFGKVAFDYLPSA